MEDGDDGGEDFLSRRYRGEYEDVEVRNRVINEYLFDSVGERVYENGFCECNVCYVWLYVICELFSGESKV